MSFAFNPATEQQLSLWDSYESLTPREKRALEKSWAKVFAEKIFQKINEAPYAVLYNDTASRPNTPVNVIIGALILKEFTGQSDDDFNTSLMFDIRYQYALHTDEFKDLSHFRNGVETIPSMLRQLFNVDHCRYAES